MFRALLLKMTLRSPLRSPLRLSAARHAHSLQAPYSGPPSYDTIARRFSPSQVDPLNFYTCKRNQETRDRGEFIDVHDVSRDPADYDVSITVISHQTLETTIAEEVGIPYLSKATETDAKVVVQVGDGFIRGPKKRTIVPLVVTHQDEARWVFLSWTAVPR
jgi:hypothetical protein